MRGLSGYVKLATGVPWGRTRYEITGVIASPPIPTAGLLPLFGEADGNAYALRKALAHFGDAELKLGVALREVKETVALATQYYRAGARLTNSLADDIQRGIRNPYAKQQWRDFKRHGAEWKGIPARYLEYLYGMKPFADDLQNAVDVLTEYRDRDFGFALSLKDKVKFFGTNSVSTGGPLGLYTVAWNANVTQTHRASLVFQLPSWYWDALPPVTAFSENWEVIRLSFIVDWFLPVNQFLRGFEGFQLRPFYKEGSVSMFLSRRFTSVTIKPEPGYTLEASVVPSPMKGGRAPTYQLNRQKLPAFPSGLLFRPPRLRQGLGLDKMDQASALLGQRLAKLSRVIG